MDGDGEEKWAVSFDCAFDLVGTYEISIRLVISERENVFWKSDAKTKVIIDCAEAEMSPKDSTDEHLVKAKV